MKSLTDSVKIPVECANCHRKIQKSLSELKRNPSVLCVCGTRIQVDGANKAAAPFDELEKSLKKLGAKRIR